MVPGCPRVAILGVMLFAAACGDDGSPQMCPAPVDRPPDPDAPMWSYSGAEDGPEDWGSIPGFSQCGTGNEQTPIDIPTGSTVSSDAPLRFDGYDAAISLTVLNNGYTPQGNYAQAGGDADPRISYAGKTYRLLQLHGHSTSEHRVDGRSFAYELHLVHQADDLSLAVVGIFYEIGAPDETLELLLGNDPGAFKETTCEVELDLGEVVPDAGGFYHYNGSLTTPACGEGVSWFVMKDPRTVAATQVEAYQELFGGTTNRPVQPLGERTVWSYHAP